MLYLCEYEYGEDYVNAPLQWLYENGFIEQLKQDEWKLQQDGQQPKSSQLWDLPQNKQELQSALHFFLNVCQSNLHLCLNYINYTFICVCVSDAPPFPECSQHNQERVLWPRSESSGWEQRRGWTCSSLARQDTGRNDNHNNAFNWT